MQGEVRNTRGPSARPLSRRGVSYKPKAKSSAAQRESEGAVVPVMGVKNNAPGGKGPWGGRAEGAGKREGMAGEPGPNDPGGWEPRDKVRQLQRRLWAGAKRAPGRRFHALYDQIWRGDVLREAWDRVRAAVSAVGAVAAEEARAGAAVLGAATIGAAGRMEHRGILLQAPTEGLVKEDPHSTRSVAGRSD